MAYKKGELKVGDYTDTRKDDYDKGQGAYLPHSCDEWVIGGLEEMLALESDLKEAIREISLPHTPEVE